MSEPSPNQLSLLGQSRTAFLACRFIRDDKLFLFQPMESLDGLLHVIAITEYSVFSGLIQRLPNSLTFIQGFHIKLLFTLRQRTLCNSLVRSGKISIKKFYL